MEEKVNDVKQATWRFLGTHPKYYIWAGVFIFLGIFLSLSMKILHFFVFGIFIAFGIYAFVANRMRGYLMQQFAKSLGYQYIKKGDMESVSGEIFKVGHSQKITHVISGDEESRPTRIFLYQYTIGYGKNSHTYNYTIFETSFSGNMPHMLLHKVGMFSSDGSGFFHFSGGEHLSLEGDFDKHFSLYVEKEFEIEAHQIFNPHFMEELINTSKSLKSLGFESYKNKLYIYTPKYIDKRQELDDMFALSKTICAHLAPVIGRISGDVDAMNEVIEKYKK